MGFTRTEKAHKIELSVKTANPRQTTADLQTICNSLTAEELSLLKNAVVKPEIKNMALNALRNIS